MGGMTSDLTTPTSRAAPTDEEPDVARVAALLGEPTRAAMCLALIDGRALPAGELAARARVSPQTASNHLDKLLRGRVLVVEQQGRWRYYRLRGEDVATAVEALAVIAPPRPATAAVRQHPTGPCATRARATTTLPASSASP